MSTADVLENNAISTIPYASTRGESLLGKRRLSSTDNDDSSNSDGYLRSVSLRARGSMTSSPSDLNNNNNKVGAGMSILAGKYLLFHGAPPMTSSPRRGGSQPPKTEMSCLNIQTKEQFLCKVIPRNPKGLSMLAAYHRLEESSEFVNQVIEAILTPKVLYLIMPKHYGNVHSYLLEKGTLDEAEAANIFKQIVEAVHHCHSKGLVLRDIKLGRFVFVDKAKSKVKLESLEDATLLMDPNNDNLDDKHGCPNYVSPEKAESLKTNLRYPGKASDLWCLGVILYTMMTGKYPFNDSNIPKLLHKIRAGNFTPIPPGLSSSVSFLITNLLKKSPAERPICSEILQSSWLAKHCVSSALTIEVVNNKKETAAMQTEQQTSCSKPSDQVVPNF